MMEQRLQSGLAALNLPVEGIPALVRYGDLLIETNKVMNLTAITDPEDVATLHFLDSAALLTLESFSGKSVVDVGTGAGFPGLPLRVLEPSIRLTLLDSLNKRIQFLETVCRGLSSLPRWRIPSGGSSCAPSWPTVWCSRASAAPSA